MNLSIGVIIPAAGQSTRFGATDKIDVEIHGKPLFRYAIDTFLNDCDVQHICIVLAADKLKSFQKKHATWLQDTRIACVVGGTERWDSIRKAMATLPNNLSHIAVHDAARPCLCTDVWLRLKNAMQSGKNAIVPVLPVQDTIRKTTDSDLCGTIVDRSHLLRIQTPQCFSAEDLAYAYSADFLQQLDLSTITDDASLMQAQGLPLHAVAGSPDNIKLTYKNELKLIRALLTIQIDEKLDRHNKKSAL